MSSVGGMNPHETSVRQHYKSQTPLWYYWKNVESDVKPEQTNKQTTVVCDVAHSIVRINHQVENDKYYD